MDFTYSESIEVARIQRRLNQHYLNGERIKLDQFRLSYVRGEITQRAYELLRANYSRRRDQAISRINLMSRRIVHLQGQVNSN